MTPFVLQSYGSIVVRGRALLYDITHMAKVLSGDIVIFGCSKKRTEIEVRLRQLRVMVYCAPELLDCTFEITLVAKYGACVEVSLGKFGIHASCLLELAKRILGLVDRNQYNAPIVVR